MSCQKSLLRWLPCAVFLFVAFGSTGCASFRLQPEMEEGSWRSKLEDQTKH